MKIHITENGLDMLTKVLKIGWIDEAPHIGVKGEFVGKTCPSGWEGEHKPYQSDLKEKQIWIRIGVLIEYGEASGKGHICK